MSNELEAIANTLPEDVRKLLAEHIAEDISRIGPTGGDTIRVTQDKKFELPDGTQVDEIEAHIVQFVYRNEYYIGAFNRKAITPPACFAISESVANLAPSKNSPMKQSKDSCAVCQQNQFGSSPTGGGKACKNTIYLALLPTDSSAATHPIWVLKTSPTAVRPFNNYVASLGRMNIPVFAAKTRIFLDPSSTYASIRFDANGVNADNLNALTSRTQEAMTRLKQEPDVSTFEPPTANK